jgi:hemerythrin-like domain-containing protein
MLLALSHDMSSAMNPIDELLQEHAAALVYITTLDDAVIAIRTEGFSMKLFLDITRVAQLIDTEVRAQHQTEERLFFVSAMQHVPEQTLEMWREHRVMWQAMSELALAVRNIEDGRIDGKSIPEMLNQACWVSQLLKRHLQKERDSFVPALRRALHAEAYEQPQTNSAPRKIRQGLGHHRHRTH